MHQTLAARFGNKENADAFKSAFEDAVSKSHHASDDEDDDEEKENADEKKKDGAEEKKDGAALEKSASADGGGDAKVEEAVADVAKDLDKMTVKTDS